MKCWYSLLVMTRLDYTLLVAGVGETGVPREKPTKTAIERASLLRNADKFQHFFNLSLGEIRQGQPIKLAPNKVFHQSKSELF